MDITDAKAFINLVTAESQRRYELLAEEDDSTGCAYDQWMFIDLPFLHDLCILYLVAIRHHVERRLLFYAACALGHGNELQPIDFEAEQKTLLALPNNKRWREIEKRLQVTQCVRYASVEALRLVANSYKHDPRLQPDIELIRHLGLDEKLIYAAIPESFELKKGLARVVGLPDDSLFVDITQRFVEHVAEFLKDLQAKSVLSPVALGKVSLTDFAH